MNIIKYLVTPAALLMATGFSYASNCTQLFNSQNYPSALKQCMTETSQSNSQACFMLGQMYEKGLGIKADPDKAINYYQLAVLANNLDSQIALGLYHENNQNYLLSHVYLTLAIENGSLGASLEKAKVEQNLSREELILSKDYVNIIKTAISQHQRSFAMN